MSGFVTNGEAAGLEQAALAMLRTLGAGKASLLVPQPVTASEQTGLGLLVPLVNEVEMEPVLLQATANGKTHFARMTRGTVRKALSIAGAIDTGEIATEQALETAMLRAGGTEYRIVSVMVKWFGGAELLYELEIEA
jgi:hypothetical protein